MKNPSSSQTSSPQNNSEKYLLIPTLYAWEANIVLTNQKEPSVEIYKDTLGRSVLCSSRGCTLIEIRDGKNLFPQVKHALDNAEPFQALDIHAHTSSDISSEANYQFFGNAMLADIQRKEIERPATARTGNRGYDYLVSFNDLVKLKTFCKT